MYLRSTVQFQCIHTAGIVCVTHEKSLEAYGRISHRHLDTYHDYKRGLWGREEARQTRVLWVWACPARMTDALALVTTVERISCIKTVFSGILLLGLSEIVVIIAVAATMTSAELQEYGEAHSQRRARRASWLLSARSWLHQTAKQLENLSLSLSLPLEPKYRKPRRRLSLKLTP